MKKHPFKILTAIFFFPIITACSGSRPTDLGIRNDQLKACPESPNCVISFPSNEEHYLASINYSMSRTEAVEKLRRIINGEKRTRIVEEKKNYIWIEFSSAIMGFVDDVEFYFPEEKVIHFRSASRLGQSDFGVNRKRMERISLKFNDHLK